MKEKISKEVLDELQQKVNKSLDIDVMGRLYCGNCSLIFDSTPTKHECACHYCGDKNTSEEHQCPPEVIEELKKNMLWSN